MNRRAPAESGPRPRRPRDAFRGGVCTVLALALGAPLALSACEPAVGPKNALDYTENARRDYEIAMKSFEDQNWEAADEQFNEIRRNYGYSRYARLAELRLADANYEQEKLAEATSGYKSFVHDYPNDPEVPYARFRIAETQYESVSQSVLLPPLEERDLSAVNDALGTIRDYLTDYPTTKHADQLHFMLEVVLGLLARHELYVARYYLAEDNFDAAVARVSYAIENFSSSGLVPEALLLLGEIYLQQKKPVEARASFERLVGQHPESPFSVPARRYLARWESAPKVLRQGVAPNDAESKAAAESRAKSSPPGTPAPAPSGAPPPAPSPAAAPTAE